jgi:hypothetical protein
MVALRTSTRCAMPQGWSKVVAFRPRPHWTLGPTALTPLFGVSWLTHQQKESDGQTLERWNVGAALEALEGCDRVVHR